MKIRTKPLVMGGLLVSALGLTSMVYAADAEPAAPAVDAAAAVAAPVSPHTLSSNIGFFTDYTFRGISYTSEPQSRKLPHEQYSWHGIPLS